jgi:DNA polymerase-3 subunit epsilon
VIEITIPEFEKKLYVDNRSQLPEKQGIYCFYDDQGTILYVGKSVNLHLRVKSHFNNGSGCSVEGHQSEIKTITYFLVDNKMYMDIYEIYMINTLKPLLNKKSAYYPKSSEPTIKPTVKMEPIFKFEFYTPQQVADKLNTDSKRVLYMLKKGDIRGFKIGGVWRIHEDDFNDFMRTNKK